MKRREFLALNGAHFAVDAYASIYGQMAAIVGLSPALLGILGTVYSTATNFSQLLMGFLADRRDLRWFLIGGLVIAAVFLSLAGLVSDSPALFPISIVLGGLGISAFHPPGAVAAARFSRHRATLSVAVFVTLGGLGFSTGPALYTFFINQMTLARSHYLMIPGLVIALAMLIFFRGSRSFLPTRSTKWTRNELKELTSSHGKEILPLFIFVVGRSTTFFSIAYFLPTIIIGRGHSEIDAATAHFVFCSSGSIGMLIVGALVGHVNRRWIQISSLVVSVPLTFIAVYPGVPYPLMLSALAIAGLFGLCTNAMHVVMAQEISPKHTNMLSSVVMGFAWGTGGLTSAVTGLLAGPIGTDNALLLTLCLPLGTLPLVVFLRPFPEKKVLAGES